jgi:mannobiose 2-epimerase
MKNFLTALFLAALFYAALNSCSTPVKENPDQHFITAFDCSFQQHILGVWYPRVIDTVYGGYLSNFLHNWTVDSSQPKMLVSQSRHVWTTSQAAMFYNDSAYSRYAEQGVSFLINHMWDKTHGGFFNLRTREGGYPDFGYKNQKMAYGNAFAIYGLVSYYKLTGDTVALDFAKKTFQWLEKHSYDKKFGGYIDPMEQDGTWTALKEQEPGGVLKDYNSTIHLLEAFTELYKAWPHDLLKTRLQGMLTLVRDTFVSPEGYLRLYYTTDWKHVTNRDSGSEVIHRKKGIDHISFGHDVETAFLMLEASHALEIEHDTTTLRIAKQMVDHSLANGFDNKYGGFFGEGYYIPGKDSITILEKSAQWWVQAEGLNALLLMSKIFPEETKYKEAFEKTWNYIDIYLIDKENGEWYIAGLNYDSRAKNAPKASIWKVNYHNGRALMNCIQMLRNENEVANHFKKLAD